MRIESVPGARKAARRATGQFQRTFQTPLNALPGFTDHILSAESSLRSGYVFVDTVVFEPTRLVNLLASCNLPAACNAGSTIAGEGMKECRALLIAALSDAIDFFFVPNPKRFLLYADHDEYTTLFAHRKGPLSEIADALAGAGFKEIPDFVRSF